MHQSFHRRLKSLLSIFIIILFATIGALLGCAGSGAGDSADPAAADDDFLDDEPTDDDDYQDDDDGDGGDVVPSFPDGHNTAWDCNICHQEDFFDAKGEPHGQAFDSPVQCVNCHEQGGWEYTDPDAPEDHGSTADCLNCHQDQHDKTWTDTAQCFVCHLPGTGSEAPSFPTGHESAWDCYICHSTDFYGAQGEPHSHQYGAPNECLTCHSDGGWNYDNPNAPEGHGATSGCLNCHQSEHGATWTEADQCFVCHDPGTAAPQFSRQHETDWNCYICHASAFNGAPKEPHQHQYTAPAECLTCHSEGDFDSPRHGSEPEDDHAPSWNCLNCHGSMHGKPWEEASQCVICHQF